MTTTICRFTDLTAERGVAALLPDGTQIAIFRTHDNGVYALSNMDPFSGAAVLARGLLADRQGRPVVVSPVYKQAFALDTGRCLDDDAVWVTVYQARVVDGMVLVGAP